MNLKSVCVALVMAALTIFVACGGNGNDHTDQVLLEDTQEVEIDISSYTPRSLVEKYYSLLKFHDHLNAAYLFGGYITASDNEKYFNAHTPISYEVTEEELSPDSSRARVVVKLVTAKGEYIVYHNLKKDVYLNSRKVSTKERIGWMLIPGTEQQIRTDGGSRNEISRILNTQWTFTDARGTKFVLKIGGIARDGESAKAEITRNDETRDVTICPHYEGWENDGVFEYYRINIQDPVHNTVYFNAQHYGFLYFSCWDYDGGYLYENSDAFNAESRERLTIRKTR